MRSNPSYASCSLLVFVTSACAVDLGPKEQAPPPGALAAVLPDCLPLTRTLESLEGRLDAQRLPDGRLLLGAGDRAFSVESPRAACDDVFDAAFEAPLFDGRPIGVDGAVTLLAGVEGYRFFSAEGRGLGVAEWNAERRSFEARALLFTADRPRFGSAATRFGDHVYVFGGLPARFLAADVYLARVLMSDVAEPAAYEYWQGGGGWTSDADLAAPIVEGGTSPSVLFDAAHDRWLMAYATPLASEIQLRSGLGVTGPWSLPLVVGRCRLPPSDPNAFCDDVTLLPAMETNSLNLGYRIGSFTSAPRNPREYWTRLVTTTWPTTLP
ncbi:MAG TPA: DUF4185 domain-containing protein [Polyangiaceae bacterium]|nr:DUF4185 domain-containing protein [Polyangiaceae bacterium]